MPVVVVGLKEAQKAMRALQPQLDKNLKIEIRLALKPVIKQAQSYVPAAIPGLSNWVGHGKGKTINKQTSMFRKGKFPLFNSATVRAGIKAELFPSRRKSSGFISLVRIVNATAAGAIIETAGRKHPKGQPWDRGNASHDYSHSLNPNAGEHFINSMPGKFAGTGLRRGRLVYRAVDENQGRALSAILKALNKTSQQTVKYVDAAKAFRSAA